MNIAETTSQLKYNFNMISSARIALNRWFYNEDIINNLIQLIQNTFETFTVLYDCNTNAINIKIKKTNLKKNDSSYVHCTQYYYPIINTIFKTLFNTYKNELVDIFGVDDITEFLSSDSFISNMYSLTTLLDNIIIIKL